MAKKRKIIDAFGNKADSKEEVYFSYWLKELQLSGYVKYVRRSNSVKLCDPLKIIINGKQISLLRELSYTADYTVWWEEKAVDVFIGFSQSKVHSAFMYPERNKNLKFTYEVKPPVDRRNTITNFVTKQKMIYKYNSILIHLVISEELYPVTFTPKYYIKYKRQINFRTQRSLNEFIKLRNKL